MKKLNKFFLCLPAAPSDMLAGIDMALFSSDSLAHKFLDLGKYLVNS